MTYLAELRPIHDCPHSNLIWLDYFLVPVALHVRILVFILVRSFFDLNHRDASVRGGAENDFRPSISLLPTHTNEDRLRPILNSTLAID